jgi:outer membrane protein
VINASLPIKLCLCTALVLANQTWAQSEQRFVGDAGMAVYKTPAITRTTDKGSPVVLPYVYADYGQHYARVDTFGYKLLPVGAGHLELTTRLSFEGYQSEIAGINNRARPKPLGVGTFQETPYGAFIFYAFRDAVSGGSLLDASYAAEFSIGDLHAYPQIGVERRDRKYVNSLYGVGSIEAQRSGLAAYASGNSISPNAAIALEYPFLDSFKLTFQVRKRWLDKSIYESPLVNVKQQTSSFIAISQTFQ